MGYLFEVAHAHQEQANNGTAEHWEQVKLKLAHLEHGDGEYEDGKQDSQDGAGKDHRRAGGADWGKVCCHGP